MVSSQLGRKENWSDSDDLAMMFQGAYYQPSSIARWPDALHPEVRERRSRGRRRVGATCSR